MFFKLFAITKLLLFDKLLISENSPLLLLIKSFGGAILGFSEGVPRLNSLLLLLINCFG